MAGGAHRRRLMTGEDMYIEGPRVALRPFRDDDVPLIELLRAEAGRPGGEGATLTITRTGEDVPIGFLDFRLDDPACGSAKIAWVALAEEHRRWGLGVDAVLQFEEEAVHRWGLRQFRADVDPSQGLALYFWLRLWYRPAESKRADGETGTIAMVRNVEAA